MCMCLIRKPGRGCEEGSDSSKVNAPEMSGRIVRNVGRFALPGRLWDGGCACGRNLGRLLGGTGTNCAPTLETRRWCRELASEQCQRRGHMERGVQTVRRESSMVCKSRDSEPPGLRPAKLGFESAITSKRAGFLRGD